MLANQSFVGEKVFSKDIPTTRVHASVLSGVNIVGNGDNGGALSPYNRQSSGSSTSISTINSELTDSLLSCTSTLPISPCDLRIMENGTCHHSHQTNFFHASLQNSPTSSMNFVVLGRHSSNKSFGRAVSIRDCMGDNGKNKYSEYLLNSPRPSLDDECDGNGFQGFDISNVVEGEVDFALQRQLVMQKRNGQLGCKRLEIQRLDEILRTCTEYQHDAPCPNVSAHSQSFKLQKNCFEDQSQLLGDCSSRISSEMFDISRWQSVSHEQVLSERGLANGCTGQDVSLLPLVYSPLASSTVTSICYANAKITLSNFSVCTESKPSIKKIITNGSLIIPSSCTVPENSEEFASKSLEFGSSVSEGRVLNGSSEKTAAVIFQPISVNVDSKTIVETSTVLQVSCGEYRSLSFTSSIGPMIGSHLSPSGRSHDSNTRICSSPSYVFVGHQCSFDNTCISSSLLPWRPIDATAAQFSLPTVNSPICNSNAGNHNNNSFKLLFNECQAVTHGGNYFDEFHVPTNALMCSSESDLHIHRSENTGDITCSKDPGKCLAKNMCNQTSSKNSDAQTCVQVCFFALLDL